MPQCNVASEDRPIQPQYHECKKPDGSTLVRLRNGARESANMLLGWLLETTLAVAFPAAFLIFMRSTLSWDASCSRSASCSSSSDDVAMRNAFNGSVSCPRDESSHSRSTTSLSVCCISILRLNALRARNVWPCVDSTLLVASGCIPPISSQETSSSQVPFHQKRSTGLPTRLWKTTGSGAVHRGPVKGGLEQSTNSMSGHSQSLSCTADTVCSAMSLPSAGWPGRTALARQTSLYSDETPRRPPGLTRPCEISLPSLVTYMTSAG
mmetsp:Transcript_7468/g.12669  ORF Transcript_7468/g.12669 Transcript_7468/m.12669 type:complete len:266 (+) Transcript_7468:383-1180(+)